MNTSFNRLSLFAASMGTTALIACAGGAMAQSSDDFDVTVTTNAAISVACGQNLSFGTVYVAATNAEAVVSLTALGAISSDDPSVVVSGGTVGQCTIAGLQGADTATLTLTGGAGVAAAGGLSDVELEDGAANTLLADIQVDGGANVSGGKSGLANGVIPVFGSVTIPASHTDFGTYDATLTATVALD